MICPKCGAENPDQANFCGTCGKSLREAREESEPMEAETEQMEEESEPMEAETEQMEEEDWMKTEDAGRINVVIQDTEKAEMQENLPEEDMPEEDNAVDHQLDAKIKSQVQEEVVVKKDRSLRRTNWKLPVVCGVIFLVLILLTAAFAFWRKDKGVEQEETTTVSGEEADDNLEQEDSSQPAASALDETNQSNPADMAGNTADTADNVSGATDKTEESRLLVPVCELTKAAWSGKTGAIQELETVTASDGTEYEHGMQASTDQATSWTEYCLDGEYQLFSAVAVFNDQFSLAEGEISPLQIYADGELVYELSDVKAQSGSCNICVKVKDAEIVKIQLTGKEVQLADVIVIAEFD